MFVSLLRWLLRRWVWGRHTWLSWGRHHHGLSRLWHRTWMSWWQHHTWLSWWRNSYNHGLTWDHYWWAWNHDWWTRHHHHRLNRLHDHWLGSRRVWLDDCFSLLNFNFSNCSSDHIAFFRYFQILEVVFFLSNKNFLPVYQKFSTTSIKCSRFIWMSRISTFSLRFTCLNFSVSLWFSVPVIPIDHDIYPGTIF